VVALYTDILHNIDASTERGEWAVRALDHRWAKEMTDLERGRVRNQMKRLINQQPRAAGEYIDFANATGSPGPVREALQMVQNASAEAKGMAFSSVDPRFLIPAERQQAISLAMDVLKTGDEDAIHGVLIGLAGRDKWMPTDFKPEQLEILSTALKKFDDYNHRLNHYADQVQRDVIDHYGTVPSDAERMADFLELRYDYEKRREFLRSYQPRTQ
jgi:hypothetical protein